jgi:AcrR family transcriptional regulator
MLERLPEHPSAQIKLLDTARRLFCRDGIHATGVSRILKEAGVARRTLYERFGSKDILLKAVFSAEAEMWFRLFAEDLRSAAVTPVSRVLMLFDLMEIWFKSGTFCGCVFINAVAEHEKNSSWIRDMALSHRTRINGLLQELVAEANDPDPLMTTEKLSLLIDGTIVAAMITGNAETAQIGRLAAQDILSRNEL